MHEILDAMFDKANINDNTEVLLSSTAYFIKISNIISTTDRSALNNYVIWNLVKEYLPYLSQNFQNIYSVYNRETTGEFGTRISRLHEFPVGSQNRHPSIIMVTFKNFVGRRTVKKKKEKKFNLRRS